VIALAVSLSAPLLSGCVAGVGWLPDSSGFVYSAGSEGDELRLFDVKTRKSRVLTDHGGGPCWPQVSPDGKRIAVVRPWGDMRNKLDVALYDFDGKRVFHDADLDWDDHAITAKDSTVPEAYWSPRGNRLLLSWNGKAGLYEPATKKLIRIEADVMTFGTSPVRPDGQRFLLTRADWRGASSEFLLCDWEGNTEEIKGPMELPRALSFPQHIVYTPWFYASFWDGPTATATWKDHRLRIDTVKRTAVFDRCDVTTIPDGSPVLQELALNGGAVVRLVEADPRSPDLGGKRAKLGTCRVEFLIPKAKEPVVLLEKVEIAVLFPSPDRRTVAIRWAMPFQATLKAREGTSGIVVVSGTGEVLGRINTHE
jgi:dipeptidyl aminopeptidase/acylaminoacyl peptidase